MEVYVILESYTDCDGGNATSFGVYRTLEKAIEKLPQTIAERLGYSSVEELEKEEDIVFNDYFVNDIKSYWVWDRDDNLIEFYVQQDKLMD